jgi:glutaredoxin
MVTGSRKGHKLRLYTLSTCAFCKRAMNYLEENDCEFQYIHLDQVDVELKREVKADLRKSFSNVPVFPILTIDDREAISGFVAQKWSDLLGIE